MGLFGKSEPDKPKSATGPRSSSTRNETSSIAARTLMGAETVITGELNTSEAVQIEGRVEGKIKSSGLVVIGEAGRVKAEIEADEVSIRGTLEGDCTARNRVEITRTGKVLGNLRAPRIVVAEGAIFRGASQMTVNEKRSGPKERTTPSSSPGSTAASAPSSTEKTDGS